MDLAAYLESLDSRTLNDLYESHWICAAVLRTLPPLAKQYVLRLLFVTEALPKTSLDFWCSPGATLKHQAAVQKLQSLHILERAVSESRPRDEVYKLQRSFQNQVQSIVIGRAGLEPKIAKEDVVGTPTAAALDSYPKEQWEGLMLYLVDPRSTAPPPAPKIMAATPLALDRLLASAGLLNVKERVITEDGFRFLLRDTYTQIWMVLKSYILNAQQQGGQELASVLSFLLQLGFYPVRRPQPLAALSPAEREIAAHMAQLGLLLPFRSGKAVWFCPTRLALALTGGPGSVNAPGSVNEGFIIVESNYHVYAYTASPLDQAILRLFVRCDCLLPNLFVGTISRESFADALASGITADQVVHYLRTHAHPHLAARTPVVPEVVADQIRLWQWDAQRVKITEAVLYDDFETATKWRLASEHARKIGAWMWEEAPGRSGRNGRLVGRKDCHAAMKECLLAIKHR